MHHHRIQPDKPPTCGVEAPAVFADHGDKVLPVFFSDWLLRRGTKLGWIIADIMVTRQTAAGNGQVVVQRFGEYEVIAIVQRVEGQIAGVNDDIGARRIDVFTHAPKIFGKFPRETGKMGIGNLANMKFAHGPNPLLANPNHTTRMSRRGNALARCNATALDAICRCSISRPIVSQLAESARPRW